MGKCRDVQWFTQGHTASQWQIWLLNLQFILSHPYKLMGGLTLSDHVCHFAYSKISAFRSRKGQSGFREEWKWPNESEDDPACGGHWEKETRNSNIRSQLQFIWGKRPSSSGAVTSFQLPDQSVLVSRHLVWHNTIPNSKGTLTEIVSFAVFRRLCVKQENHLGASQTWVEISPRRELDDTGRILILQLVGRTRWWCMSSAQHGTDNYCCCSLHSHSETGCHDERALWGVLLLFSVEWQDQVNSTCEELRPLKEASETFWYWVT